MKKTLNQKVRFIFWTVSPVLIGIFLASVIFNSTFGDTQYKKINQPEENTATTANLSTEDKETLKYFYFIKDQKQKPNVSALAYLVGDLDTGEIILSKNQDLPLPIASISKLITAFTAMQLMNSEETTLISKKARATYGANGNLRIGEEIKLSDLIYPLLLESSNDASEALAEYFNRDNFIKKMNQIAVNLKLWQTKFEDPSGLSPSNQSSVLEMFKLIGYINQKKPEIFEITTERSYANGKHNWSNTSQFLKETGYLGGKSGYTDLAMQTVISIFSTPISSDKPRNIMIALLQSKDRYRDVKNLLNYLNKNVYYGEKDDANADWVKAKSNIAEMLEKDFATIVFAGDIMLDRGVTNSVNKNFNGDYSALFEELLILKKSDIVFANLEGPASDKGADKHNLYSFRMNPSVIPALKGAGISVLSIANNHIGDFGIDALTDTLIRLKENEILYTGGGMNQREAERPSIIEKHGIKFGFLGFSDVGPNELAATSEKPGILLANNPRFAEIIKNASQEVDHLIVSFHFGDEYQKQHNDRQEYLARKAIDSGATVVIGHHPHVIQDTEIYKNGFIAYSLGNFIFDQAFSADTMEGMLLEIKIDKNEIFSIKKNISKLNQYFQPEKIIPGKEEK